MSRVDWGHGVRGVAALAALVLAIGAGCGGRDEEDDDLVDPTLEGVSSFGVSGTITAASGTAVDSDTNDILAPFASNDSAALAQEIPNPVTLGGLANAAGAGFSGQTSATGDLSDWYRVSIAAGQTVRLRLAEDGSANNLDLELLDPDDESIVQSSTGTSRTEEIVVATTDDYYVVVRAISGFSNYTLTIGQTPTGGVLGVSDDAEFVPGHVIVRYRDDYASVSATSLAEGMGLRHVAGSARGPVLLAASTVGERQKAWSRLGIAGAASASNDLAALREDTLRLVEAVRAQPGVQSADPNFVRHPSATPTDEFFPFQWHFDQINLPQAWDLADGSGVVVAVLDTGVKGHPDLAGQLVAGYDTISDPVMADDGGGCDANPDDPGDGTTPGSSSYHGTHVIGTVAARTSLGGGGSAGVAGSAFAAQVMPLRVLGVGGGTDFDIMAALRYAANRDNACSTTPGFVAPVVNMSLGGPGFSQTFQDLVTDLRTSEGMIFVAAAGNDGSSALFYPAAYDGVISVSAVGQTRTRAPYSNFGSTIDVAAPGGNFETDVDGDGYPDGVLSTLFDESDSSFVYSFYQGTSMAAPHVAGVIALMLEVNPLLTPFDIDNALNAGELTEDIGDSNLYGNGLIDAAKAVLRADEIGGGATTLDPFLRVTPGALNYGFLGTTFLLDATNGGDDGEPLVVTGVSDDAPWLGVAGESVDGNGLGSYRADVDRTGLADGIYTATISFTTDANDVDVNVIMQVGDPASITADAGFHYVLLVDPSTFTVTASTTLSATNGQYVFSIPDVPAGNYYLVAGSDLDNDFFICDPGEACGGHPTTESITPIVVDGNESGLVFVTGFTNGISGANTGAPPSSGSGWRRDP